MQSQMIYKWSVPVYPMDAQTAGMELERITEKRGSLKPSYVVEESRYTGAALHKCFEWNNRKAADKYRCRQAQDILRNIVAVKIGRIETPLPIRAFVNIRKDHEYVPVIHVLNTPVLRENMLNSAMRELESFRRKYIAIESLSELMASIDRSIRDYNGPCAERKNQ